MLILKALASIFLFPGTMVLNVLDISVEQDGGMLRSFVNMVVWGIVAVLLVVMIVF